MAFKLLIHLLQSFKNSSSLYIISIRTFAQAKSDIFILTLYFSIKAALVSSVCVYIYVYDRNRDGDSLCVKREFGKGGDETGSVKLKQVVLSVQHR